MTNALSDPALQKILQSAKVIAVVGASSNPTRPSHYVAKYLAAQRYRIIPVNPGQAGQTLLGERVYGSLSDIPADIEVDFVDIFRPSEAVPAIVEEAIGALPALSTIWMQVGIRNAQAAARARAAGLDVVEDRCTKTEHKRLLR